MQARPGASLVVAQPELLLASLMEPLHGPALVGQAELVVEWTGIERPGEGPLRLAVLARQWPLADEPADRSGRIAVRPMHAHPASLPQACRWRPCCWGSRTVTVTVAHCASGMAAVSACAVCSGATWAGCG